MGTARIINAQTGQEALTTIADPVPTQADYSIAIQALIDQTAQAKSYADGNSCVSYVGDSVNPDWDAEASAFKTWRSEVWAYAFTQLALVQSGERSPQPSVAEILSELPTMTWPE